MSENQSGCVRKKIIVKSVLIIMFMIVIFFGFAPIFQKFLFGVAFAEQMRESWVAYQRKGTVFGYEHLKINTSDDKTIEYLTERVFKVDVVGMSQQDIKENAVWITDKNFNPVSFSTTVSYKVKSEKITGSVENGRLNVTYDDQCGVVSKKTFDASGLYFNVCLADIIIRRSAEKEFSVNVFDTYYVRRAGVRVLKNEGTVEAEVSIEGTMPEIITIDSRGLVISSVRAVETLVKVDGKTFRTDEKIRSGAG